jgi:hypothetical protein
VVPHGRGGDERAVTELGDDLDVVAHRAEAVAHVLEPDAVVSGGHVDPGSVVAYLEM